MVRLRPRLLLCFFLGLSLPWQGRAECKKRATKTVETIPGQPEQVEYWLYGACKEKEGNQTWCCCRVTTAINATYTHEHKFCSRTVSCTTDAQEQTAACVPNEEPQLPEAAEFMPLWAIIVIVVSVAVVAVAGIAFLIWYVWRDMEDVLQQIRRGVLAKSSASMRRLGRPGSPSASSSSKGGRAEHLSLLPRPQATTTSSGSVEKEKVT